jgi:hypothetical protein
MCGKLAKLRLSKMIAEQQAEICIFGEKSAWWSSVCEQNLIEYRAKYDCERISRF